MFSVDPEVPTITAFSAVTQTSVKLSWSVGRTNVVNSSVVHYVVYGLSNWLSETDTSRTSCTVRSLQPGTRYQFVVVIASYGKHSTSAYGNTYTGKVTVICTRDSITCYSAYMPRQFRLSVRLSVRHTRVLCQNG